MKWFPIILFVPILSFSQNTLELAPGPIEGIDAFIHEDPQWITSNFSDFPNLNFSTWTFGGNPSATRSLIDFDLSSIPVGANILNARLNLFFAVNPDSNSHATLSGSNEAWIQRITSPWDEHVVTWVNQPSTTTQNQVSLPASNYPDQDYPNIDLTDVVQDWVDNPGNSFGLMLRMKNEVPYKRLTFASSDHPDSSLHPQLTVTYEALPVSGVFDSGKDPFQGVSIYPNPLNDIIHVINPAGKTMKIDIIDPKGRLVFREEIGQTSATFNLGPLVPGMYYFKGSIEGTLISRKLLVQ